MYELMKRKPGRPKAKINRDELAEDYNSGMKLKDIAAKWEVCMGTITTYIREMKR